MHYNYQNFHSSHYSRVFRYGLKHAKERCYILGIIISIAILIAIAYVDKELLTYALPIILFIWLIIYIHHRIRTHKHLWTLPQKRTHHGIIKIMVVIFIILCFFGGYHLFSHKYNKEPPIKQRDSNMSTYALIHAYQNIARSIQGNNSNETPLSYYFAKGEQNNSCQQLNNWATNQREQLSNIAANTMKAPNSEINVAIVPTITSQSYQSKGILNVDYKIKYTVTNKNNKTIRKQHLNGNATLKDIQGNIKIISNKLNI